MIVHLTTSRRSVVKEFETLKKIISAVNSTGNVLARDWIESQYYIDVAKTADELHPEVIYKHNMDAIARADLVIIETSERSFGSGFQAAVALQRKKPTLLLIQERHAASESAIARGIADPLLTRRTYLNQQDLEDIIKSFIHENTFRTKDLRFNFVLDPQLYNHIRWKSFKSNKTKAEIVRELLIKDMEQN